MEDYIKMNLYIGMNLYNGRLYWVGEKVSSYFLIQNCIYNIFVKNERNLN